KNPLAIALEPRFLLDAAAVATATEVAADQAAQDAAVQAEQAQTAADDSAQDAAQAIAELAVAPTAAPRQEIAFIDTGINGWEALRDGVREGVEVILLDTNRNGLQQISDVLEGRNNLGAIHLVSHGESGGFKAGNIWVRSDNLSLYQDVLTQIGAALAPDGDILLYGCKTGEGATGSDFIDNLARLTQSDVAASANNTGTHLLGGDWLLESQSGSIEAVSMGVGMASFNALLAAPTSENFDSVMVGGDGRSYGGSPRIINGWTISLLDSGGNNVPVSGDSPSSLDVTSSSDQTQLASSGDDALYVNGFFGTVAEARFSATSGDEFWLQSFRIENPLMNEAVRVVGYRDGVLVATQDFSAPFNQNVLVTLDHNANSDWQNVDQFG